MNGFFPTMQQTKTPLPTVAQCGMCKLNLTCKSPKMKPSGKGKQKILVIGEAPGADEDLQGRQFVGKTGRYLASVVRKLGYDLYEDCWLTNSAICRPPGNELEDKHVGFCRPNLVDTITELQPEIIIPLGKHAVSSLIGWLWREDVGEIGRWVGWRIPNQKLNSWICPTWHPSYIVRSEKKGKLDPVLEMFFEKHLNRAFSKKSRPWKQVPDYRKLCNTTYDVEMAARIIRNMMTDAPVAWDIETDRLKPDHPESRILTCAVSDGKITLAYPWHGEAVTATKELLKSCTPKIGYSQKFEQRWIRRILKCNVNNWVWDGMLNAHLLDNRLATHSLKFQAFVLFGQGSYDHVVRPYMHSESSNLPNRLHKAPLDQVLLYNAMDALLEYKVAKRQARQLGVEL